MALTFVGAIFIFCAGRFLVASKRFGFLVLTAAIAVVMALPAAASATGTYFSISGLTNGYVYNPISAPGWAYLPGYEFQSTPNCTWDGGTPATCPGTLPATAGMHTLVMSGQIVTNPGGASVAMDTDTVTFEYDPTDPIVTLNSPPIGAELSQKRPVFDFSVSDDPVGGYSVSCTIDMSAEFCSSPYQPSSNLSEGSHSFIVSVEDGINNTFVARSFIVDTVAPVISVVFPTAGVTVDSSVPEVNLSIEGATAGSFCRFDDQAYQSCGASWLGGSLADGAHTLFVRGVDIAGNETVVVVPFFVDDSLGATPVPYETSITGGRGGKVKRGKFKVKAGFSLLGPEGSSATILCAAKVKATLKPKGGRTYTDRIQLLNKNGRCVASTTFTLPKRFKGKRAKLTFRYPGTAALGVLSRSKTITKL